LRPWFESKRKRCQYPGFIAGSESLQLKPAFDRARGRESVASNHRVARAVIFQTLLLGNVNFFFLIHMPQENQQRTSAEHQRQDDGNNTIPDEVPVWTGEPEEENIDRATH
jgi:hypothetical protein